MSNKKHTIGSVYCCPRCGMHIKIIDGLNPPFSWADAKTGTLISVQGKPAEFIGWFEKLGEIMYKRDDGTHGMSRPAYVKLRNQMEDPENE